MNSIYCIGIDFFTKDHDAVLYARSARVIRFNGIGGIRSRTDEKPDLILVDKGQAGDPAFNDFLKTYADVPKIVCSPDHSFRGLGRWLKRPRTYPAYAPSPRELDFIISRAIDHKELAEENRVLKSHLANLSREMDFFEEVNKTLTSTLELNEILTTIMKKSRNLIKAESWSLLLMDQDTGELVFEKITGKKETRKRIKKFRLKLGEGIAGWVAQEGIPVVVPDVSLDKRFCSKIDKEADFSTKSLMCVPIKSKGSTLGVLEIVNKTTHEPFTKEDLALMMRLVDQAAIAIERASLYQKMAELSVTDDLTKLFNTRYLNRTLEIEITRSKRHKASLSLIFMDIDHFKAINDNYGHLVGSKLLVEMGQLLIKSLRTIDIVARYGGDEFVVVLPQTQPQAAIQIAERIRRAIEQNLFLKKDGYSLRMTASFGVASYPESAKSKEDLLRLADEAMYRVKFNTRNGVYAIV